MNFKLLLSLASSLAVAYALQSNGLMNLGSSCYMNTALQAIASIPAVSNLILSIDSKTLTNKKHQDTLLQLQTIMYTLRTDGVKLNREYLFDFLKNISATFPGGWNTSTQQDESEFYQFLIQSIERDLLPADKRTTFHDLVHVRQEIITKSASTYQDDLMIRIQGTSATVNSVETGLEEYFRKQVVSTNAGDNFLHHRIATDPSILSVYVNRFPNNAADKNDKRITIPDRIGTVGYRSDNLQTSIPGYELQFIAVHHGDRLSTGHYYGYKNDGKKWIKLDDSNVTDFNGNVTEIASQGQDTALMLHYVIMDPTKHLLTENPIPEHVMTLIKGEIAKHATVDPKKVSTAKPKNDASTLTSVSIFLLSVVLAITLLI